jgi:hypothetical protein
MKPSTTEKGFFFRSSSNKDDNNSSLSNYWNKSIGSTIKLKKTCINHETVNYYITNSRLLLKIFVIFIFLMLIGFIVTSLRSPASDHRPLPINQIANRTTSDASSMLQINNNFVHSSSSSNVITSDLQTSSDEYLNNKNLVRIIYVI